MRATIDRKNQGRFFLGDNAPLLKNNENVKLSCELKVDVLSLDKEEDLKRYTSICDMITKGFYSLSAEDRHWDEDAKNWKIFIRYVIRVSLDQETLDQKIVETAKYLDQGAALQRMDTQ